MNIAYMIYQTERTPTRAEQREIDMRNGQLAAAIAKYLRELTAPFRSAADTAGAACAGTRAASAVTSDNS